MHASALHAIESERRKGSLKLLLLLTIVIYLPNAIASIPGSSRRFGGFGQGPISECTTELTSSKAIKTMPETTKSDQEVTQPTGKGRTFSLKIKNKRIEATIYTMNEVESRADYTTEKSPVNIAKDLNFLFNTPLHQLLNIKTDVKTFNWVGGLYLAPLSSEFEEFHDSALSTSAIDQKTRVKTNTTIQGSKETQGQLNTKVFDREVPLKEFNTQNEGSWNQSFARNYMEINYWLGWRKETSLYFDTANDRFAKSGIAIRAKFWRKKDSPSVNKMSEVNDQLFSDSTYWSITIKENIQNYSTIFTERREHHIKLSGSIKMEDLASALEKALIRLKLAKKDVSLQLRNVINNERVGLNIMEQLNSTASIDKDSKVGFLVIDEFTRHSSKDGELTYDGKTQQFEVEVLPEYLGRFYTRSSKEPLRREFYFLVSALTAQLKAHTSLTPKYLQDLRK